MAPPGRRRTRRRIVGGLATVVTVAVVAGVGIVAMSGRSEAPTIVDAAAPPRFVDEAAIAGIDHVYDGDFEFFVGGGVAAFDCDADGRSDLYFAGGSEPAALFHNASPVDGALRFSRRPSPVTDLTAVAGAYPLDIDSDGHLDLVVLRVGGNAILRGTGDCEFEPANERFGIDSGDDWTAAFSAAWEGTETLPTLEFGSYLVPDANLTEADRLGGGICGTSRLMRPDATGEHYDAPIPLDPGYCTLSMLFSDWNRSGTRDLRITNDRHYSADAEEQLWQIESDRAPRQYDADDGWRPLQIWGMGIASHDVTGDGLPDVFITSQGDNKLQTLDGDPGVPTFRDIALRSGLTLQRPFTGGDVLPSTAWHPEFADVNNDGLIDLFVSKGNVEAQPDFASRDPSNLLIGQPDGSFVEGAEAAGIVDFERSRGAALVDLNLNGMLDLVVVNRQSNVSVWRNAGLADVAASPTPGNWIGLHIEQAAPNVDAIGAWIDVRVGERTVTEEITVGGGHAGGQIGWRHVGLGNADDADVRITWPDGDVGPWIGIDANQFVTIERGRTDPIPWTPEP